MYADIRHIESALDIADRDTGLEFDEQDAYEKFLEFYDDVYPEFQKSGRIVQFKVCCNYEQHLRGNVYVQYTSEEECQKAFADFNGRWYAGRQLSCEFSPVTNWKSAICGLFEQNRCPRGKNCNFLHVYRNPNDWSDRRSENRRYNRDKYSNREDSRHHSSRSRTSSHWSQARTGSRRNDDRDSYDDDDREYEQKRRRRRRRRSQSYSDDESRKRRRRRRSWSKSSDQESDEVKKLVTLVNVNEALPKSNDIDTRNDKHHRKHHGSRRKSRSPDSDKSSRSHRKSKKKRKKHKRRRKSYERGELSESDSSC